MGRGETAVGNRNEFKRKKAGFTLPEVLLVLGILTVLLALAVPGVLAIQANAKQTSKTTYEQACADAAAAYASRNPHSKKEEK